MKASNNFPKLCILCLISKMTFLLFEDIIYLGFDSRKKQ